MNIAAPNTLYNLAAEHADLAAILASATGDDGEISSELDTLVQRLESLEQAIPEKVEGICKAIRNLSAEAAVIRAAADQWQAEADRIRRPAEQREATVARLKAYLQTCLLQAGCTKPNGKTGIVAGSFTVSVVANSQPSIEYVGPGDPPEPYRRTTVALDYAAARDAWKRGELPDAGFVVSVGKHVRIT